jgi:hypothetical protein
MLNRILLGFGLLSNFATLLGLWIAYIAASETVQARVGHVLLVAGAISSIITYLVLAFFVLRHKHNTTDQHAVDGISKKQIYVGPHGMPISIVNDNARVHIVIFLLWTWNSGT